MSLFAQKVSSNPTKPYELSRQIHRLRNVIFLSLLALIALAAIPYGSVEPWWRGLGQSVVFALAALSLIEIHLSGEWDISNHSLLVPLIALALFAFVQTIPIGRLDIAGLPEPSWRTISADPRGTRNWVAEMLALILLAAMLLRYARQRRRLEAVVYVVIGTALVSAIFGIFRQMMQHQLGFGLPNLRPGFGYAQFINKNHFAFLMEMGFGLTLALITWRGLPRDRLLIAIAVLLLLGGTVVLANSRGGILSLICELVFGALLFTAVAPVHASSTRDHPLLQRVRTIGKSSLVRVILMMCCLAIVAVGVIWIGGAPLVASLEAVPGEVGEQTDNSRWAVRRWDIWPATLDLIKDHPVAGVGFGGFWMSITEYHNASGEMTPQEAHNDYLEFAASGGLVGLALGAWFLYVFIRAARKHLRGRDRFVRAAKCGALLGLSGVAVHSTLDFGLHIPINAVLFITLVVLSTIEFPGEQVSTRQRNSSDQ
jgi:O-antigen ligase